MSERIPIRIDNRSHKLDSAGPGAYVAAAAAAEIAAYAAAAADIAAYAAAAADIAADIAAAAAPDRGSADEQLGDLDRVERCAFAEVVVADE